MITEIKLQTRLCLILQKTCAFIYLWCRNKLHGADVAKINLHSEPKVGRGVCIC